MNTRPVSLLLATLVLGGCATQASLTVFTQPEGAYLSEKGTGKVYGVAPATVVYDSKVLEAYKGPDGCYRVKGLEARWVSGATAGLPVIRLCGASTGAYNITFSRDPKFPDLERDLQFALQLQSIRAQQKQAQAAEDAAAAAMYRNMFVPPSKPVNCTSTQFGNTVQTNCF